MTNEKVLKAQQILDSLDTNQLKRVIDALDRIIAEDKYQELRFILGRQPLPLEHMSTLNEYVNRRKAEPTYSDVLLYMDLFNFGKMCGKQEERARKRGQQNG